MALPTYKEILELIKKGATFEAQEKIMELREACMQLQEEVLQLKAKNRELESQLSLRANLRFLHRLYYLGDDPVPYCPFCYEGPRKQLRHLSGPKALGGTKRKFECFDCDKDYFEEDSGDFICEPGIR